MHEALLAATAAATYGNRERAVALYEPVRERFHQLRYADDSLAFLRSLGESRTFWDQALAESGAALIAFRQALHRGHAPTMVLQRKRFQVATAILLVLNHEIDGGESYELAIVAAAAKNRELQVLLPIAAAAGVVFAPSILTWALMNPQLATVALEGAIAVGPQILAAGGVIAWIASVAHDPAMLADVLGILGGASGHRRTGGNRASNRRPQTIPPRQPVNADRSTAHEAVDDHAGTRSAETEPPISRRTRRNRRLGNHDVATTHDQDEGEALAGLGSLSAKDIVDERDPRLLAVQRLAKRTNDDVARQVESAIAGIPNVELQHREKKPKSILGKLQETEGMTIEEIKDLSGVRINLQEVNKPGFKQHAEVVEALVAKLGIPRESIKDYNAKPNSWGYTGRVHLFHKDARGVYTEIQVGTQELSDFIEITFKMSDGTRREIHDLTGYKGKLYGLSIPEPLQREYQELIGEIGRNNGAGRNLVDNPELVKRVQKFQRDVQEFIDGN
jgi:ppGpp synthetase/RelA/SpoT-type nucleotidyltranferase